MKTKVLTYANDGNTLVMPYKELTKFEGLDGVYYYPEIDKYNGERWHLVFEFNGIFVVDGSYSKDLILKPENFAMLQPAKDAYLNRWQSTYVQVIFIKVYELLGIDASPLLARRAKMQLEREAEKQRKEAENIERAKIAESKERERLTALFEQFKAGGKVCPDDFISIAKLKGLELHPRTIGMINKLSSTSQIGEKSASLGGKKKVSRQTFDSVFKAAELLAAA